MYDSELIKFRLRRKGYTLSQVAAELGLHRSTVCNLVQNRYDSPQTVRFIEQVLGEPLPKLETLAA